MGEISKSAVAIGSATNIVTVTDVSSEGVFSQPASRQPESSGCEPERMEQDHIRNFVPTLVAAGSGAGGRAGGRRPAGDAKWRGKHNSAVFKDHPLRMLNWRGADLILPPLTVALSIRTRHNISKRNTALHCRSWVAVCEPEWCLVWPRCHPQWLPMFCVFGRTLSLVLFRSFKTNSFFAEYGNQRNCSHLQKQGNAPWNIITLQEKH